MTLPPEPDMPPPRRVLVTPALAKEWLKRSKGNRNLRTAKLAEIKSDMTNDRWQFTHQGIAFNCDGSLKDGHHRLTGVVETDTSQWFWVFEGLTDEALLYIDTHAGRRLDEVANLVESNGFTGRIHKGHVAIARRMYFGFKETREFGRFDTIAFVKKHYTAIQFSVDLTRHHKGGMHSSVLAAVSRAYYTQDRARLASFLECLTRGVVSSQEDSAVVPLYRILTAKTEDIASISGRTRLYRKAISSLSAFLDRRPISKLYEASADPFPIPA